MSIYSLATNTLSYLPQNKLTNQSAAVSTKQIIETASYADSFELTESADNVAFTKCAVSCKSFAQQMRELLQRKTPENMAAAKSLVASQTKIIDSKVASIIDSLDLSSPLKKALKFTINQKGEIKVTAGTKNAADIKKIEEALNSEAGLSKDLLELYAAKDEIGGRSGRISKQILGISTKQSAYQTDTEPKPFNIGFSYNNGVTLSNDELSSLKSARNKQTDATKSASARGRNNGRIATTADLFVGSQSRMSALLGMSKAKTEQNDDISRLQQFQFGEQTEETWQQLTELTGMKSKASDKQSFLVNLNSSIDSDMRDIQTVINELVAKFGVDLGNRRITFSLDEKGKISIGGINDNVKIKKIEDAINKNDDLANQIHAIKAKTVIFDKVMYEGGFDMYDEENAETVEGILNAFLDNNADADFSDFLDSGISVDAKTGENQLMMPKSATIKDIHALKETPWLESVLVETIAVSKDKKDRFGEPDKSTENLLWLKNGVISEAFNAELTDLNGVLGGLLNTKVNYLDSLGKQLSLSNAISKYNSTLSSTPSLQIRDFSIVLNDRGMPSITDMRAVGDASAEELASLTRIVQSWLGSEAFQSAAKGAAEKVLVNHDIQHGDVADYEHDVLLKMSGGSFVRSEEADTVALANLAEKTEKLSVELGGFIRDTFIQRNAAMDKDERNAILSVPINVSVDGNGKMSLLNENPNGRMQSLLEETLSVLNERIDSDDPLGEGLPFGLQRSVELLCGIKDDMSRIHDPAKKKTAMTLKI